MHRKPFYFYLVLKICISLIFSTPCINACSSVSSSLKLCPSYLDSITLCCDHCGLVNQLKDKHNIHGSWVLTVRHKNTLTCFILFFFFIIHPTYFTTSTWAALHSHPQWPQAFSQAGTVHLQHKSVGDTQIPSSRHPCYFCHIYLVTSTRTFIPLCYIMSSQDWHVSPLHPLHGKTELHLASQAA